MGIGSQMFQTFEGAKLLPDATYYIAFDSYISVGFVNEDYPYAYLYADISYGTGSGSTSGFGGPIAASNLAAGSTAYFAPMNTTADTSAAGQSFSYSFSTKSLAAGFVAGANDIAIYLQPSVGFGVNAAQLYLDNVTVTAIPEPGAALLGSLGLLALLRRRRA